MHSHVEEDAMFQEDPLSVDATTQTINIREVSGVTYSRNMPALCS